MEKEVRLNQLEIAVEDVALYKAYRAIQIVRPDDATIAMTDSEGAETFANVLKSQFVPKPPYPDLTAKVLLPFSPPVPGQNISTQKWTAWGL